jgi:beta-lactamase class A
MLRRHMLALPALAATAPSLDEAVKREIAGLDAEVWISARNLDSGASYALRENERVRTASTIKLPILAATFAQVAAGKARWDEFITLREEDKVSGSGVLSEFSAGLKLPLQDLAHVMIVLSDNTATNLVLDRITAEAVNAFMDTLGLTATRSLRKVRGDGTQLKAAAGWSKAGLAEENQRFGLGVSTSREMVALLDLLERGKVVGEAASREMIAILKRQQYKDGIGRRLAQFEIASKSGALDALRSDVGIVYTPGGRVALAITVDGLKTVDYGEDNVGLLAIGRLAEQLVKALAPGA